MVVVVAAAGGVKPALRPRALQPSRPLHRGGTLTLASPRALRSRRRGPRQICAHHKPRLSKQKGGNPQIATGGGLKRPRLPNRSRRRPGRHRYGRNREGSGRGGRSARAFPLSDECGGERRCACVAWVVLRLCSLSPASSPFFTAQMFLFTCRTSPHMAASRSGTALAR